MRSRSMKRGQGSNTNCRIIILRYNHPEYIHFHLLQQTAETFSSSSTNSRELIYLAKSSCHSLLGISWGFPHPHEVNLMMIVPGACCVGFLGVAPWRAAAITACTVGPESCNYEIEHILKHFWLPGSVSPASKPGMFLLNIFRFLSVIISARYSSAGTKQSYRHIHIWCLFSSSPFHINFQSLKFSLPVPQYISLYVTVPDHNPVVMFWAMFTWWLIVQ